MKFKNLLNDINSIARESASSIVNDNAQYYFSGGSGRHNATSLADTGVVGTLSNGIFDSTIKKSRDIISQSPNGTILVKKKVFSTLSGSNDVKFMDATEKMLLRATKALFAYKVQQIRSYESLMKFNNFRKEQNAINLNLLDVMIREATALKAKSESIENLFDIDTFISDIGNVINKSQEYKDRFDYTTDLLDLVRRNTFSVDSFLTTWIIDPSNPDPYGLGPGTGVIELGTFTTFSCSTSLDANPSSASFTLENPYGIGIITEEDIEVGIQEALTGEYNLFRRLIEGDMQSYDSITETTVNTGSLSSSLLTLAGFTGDGSIDIDYIRQQLRIFYLGKHYVNVADGVHFYVASNSSKYIAKDKIMDKDLDEMDEIVLEAERRLLGLESIDLESYKEIRRRSEDSYSMIHIFGGYINSCSDSYGGGKYTAQFGCIDNMGWLKWSRYLKSPALEEIHGPLEDPLTPFKFITDDQKTPLSDTGFDLLDENKELLTNNLISYDSGLLTGSNAKESNIFQGEYSDFGSLYGTKAIQHPDGFVYRWKSGILSLTADFQSVNRSGNSFKSTKVHAQQMNLTATEEVLSNLDIANILSILIVGEPYNVNSFIERTYEAHNFSSTSANSLNPTDPISSLIQTVKKQNNYYGNFKPYRMVTMNSRSAAESINVAQVRKAANTEVSNLQKRKEKILKQISNFNKNFDKNKDPVQVAANARDNAVIATLLAEVDSINLTINSKIQALKDSNIIGGRDDLQMSINLFGQNNSIPFGSSLEEEEAMTKAMTQVGAMRRIEDVRLNRDKNFFIVSDQYDAMIDLRPFLLNIKTSGFKLFNGDYIDIHERCSAASGYLNLEFFCNSQGHIEFRPPQWNRIPLSTLNELLAIKKNTGRDVIPDFITSLFETRRDSLLFEIHRLNVQIALLCLLLGRYPDSSIIPGMNLKGKDSLLFFGLSVDDRNSGVNLFGAAGSVGTGDQVGVSSSLNRRVLSKDKSNIEIGLDYKFVDTRKFLNGNVEDTLGEFDPIFQESTSVLQDILQVSAFGGSPPAASFATPDNLQKIRDEFIKIFGADPASDFNLAGKKFSKSDFYFTTKQEQDLEVIADIENKDRTDVLSKIRLKISERDGLVTVLKRNNEKIDEFEDINNILTEGIEDQESKDNFLSKAEESISYGMDFINSVSSTKKKSSLFDYLIEDDDSNILGYGSGKRYIIEDAQIISASFKEQPPDYTRINVYGDAPLGMGNALKGSTGGLYFWAGATDFDLWRQYGYKSTNQQVPFLNDSEGQCKPYAILQLQLQRVKIHTGSLDVVGNEFYQPGDVVYVRARNMLYYVQSVNHSFTIGSGFRTTLSLSFGHPAGVYLPSPLDVVGQQFTTDILKDKFINYRGLKSDSGYTPFSPDSAIVFPNVTTFDKKSVLSTSDNMVRFSNMMLDLSSNILSNSKYLMIRVFISGTRDQDTGENTATARAMLDLVKDMFVNPEMVTRDTPGTINLSDITDVNNIISGIKPSSKTSQLRLPNGIIPTPVNPNNIILQLTYLDKTTNEAEEVIQCTTPSLVGSIFKEENFEIDERVINMLPKGGPKQRSWLDIRSIETEIAKLGAEPKVLPIVEIGILDLTEVRGVNNE
jgi:hypothetical protein